MKPEREKEMLRMNSKKVSESIKSYILENIDRDYIEEVTGKGFKNGKIDRLFIFWWLRGFGFNFGSWIISTDLNSEKGVKNEFLLRDIFKR